MTDSQHHYSIGAVERDSGIGRDTLRVWERRYGYPVPSRNDRGERIYSEEQLRHLQRVRRLMGQGYRPGKLLRLDEPGLLALEGELEPAGAVVPDGDIAAIIDAVHGMDTLKIDEILRVSLERQGMKEFVIHTVAPLLRSVGELWASGSLDIYQEHILTQQLIRFLNVEITKLQAAAKKPLVLLATLPGEAHTLGLLMVAAMLSSHQVSTLNLGGEVPVDQVVNAADHFNVDVVGITFSSAYQYSSIRPDLIELRRLLPEGVDIWAGGEGVRRLRKLPEGVTKFTTLENLPL